MSVGFLDASNDLRPAANIPGRFEKVGEGGATAHRAS